MLRESNPDMSPTTAFRSLSMSPPPDNTNSVLDDIFGEPSPPQQAPTLSQLDDVFGCSPPDATAAASVLSIEPSNNDHEVSDIPRLRSIHVTAGYRDGIAVSKAAHVQDGFDEGYPLGAVLGLQAGRAVGVLEGVVAALRCARVAAGKHQASLAEKEDEDEEERLYATTKHLLQQAREELDVAALFSPQYFDGEGIWRFHVDGHEEDITFEVVAAQHPLIVKWTAAVEQLARDLDLDLDRLDRRAREDHSAGDQAALLR
ncbi:uncharacterized protein J3D65DRAFT_365322 [Phyllosticta citribraziliensis]|uniref:Protein YAE1 n=1 Tax=Phyllosticta citribraziliensis TaxID=989973 RepID=A0ABR1LPJ3_9PEZI